MCPHGALAAVETAPGRAVRHLSAMRDRFVHRLGRKAARQNRHSAH
jgi:hypothetical protein